jgi:hypothetical protein
MFVTVAVPVAAWALEQAARRAEARDTTSPTSRRLRQGASFAQRFKSRAAGRSTLSSIGMNSSPTDAGRTAPKQHDG